MRLPHRGHDQNASPDETMPHRMKSTKAAERSGKNAAIPAASNSDQHASLLAR